MASAAAQVWLEGAHEDQDFLNTSLYPLGTQRKGDQYDFSLGGLYALTPADRFTGVLDHREKFAQNVGNGYRRESLDVEYTRLLGLGMYASLGTEFDFDRYDGADPTIDPSPRHDNLVVVDVLFGAPLTLMWKKLDGFSGTLAYQRYQAGSNIESYQYTNDKITALITYQWGL